VTHLEPINATDVVVWCGAQSRLTFGAKPRTIRPQINRPDRGSGIGEAQPVRFDVSAFTGRSGQTAPLVAQRVEATADQSIHRIQISEVLGILLGRHRGAASRATGSNDGFRLCCNKITRSTGLAALDTMTVGALSR
jgi:hypothetical protein